MTRSLWRTFLTVFLVVFLGGLGVSGAAALWSVQATLTAAVPTGTWAAPPSEAPEPGRPWTPCLRATVLDKNNSVLIRLEWTAPDGYTVDRVEVHGGKNGERTVEMGADGRSALLSLPEGTADYRLVMSAETASGQSHQIERTLSFQPSGKEGEVAISPGSCG
ncbi:MAG: hypothetical protein QJR09_03135 [Micrococcus sp.]|nr:hypothetical protein [Micrococcus sp.]